MSPKPVNPRPAAGRAQKTACNICGAKVKPSNLEDHMERVHPEGEASEEAIRAMTQIKMAARRDSAAQVARVAIPAVVVVVLLILVYYFVVVYETPPEKAPGWDMQEVETDVKYDSDDYYDEGVTLIEFFHSECHTCGEMADVFFDIYANYSAEINEFFSIGGYTIGSTGHTDTKDTLADFKDDHGSNWPHLYDTSHKLMREFGANSYPTLYIIKDGQIVETQVGQKSYNQVSSLIEKHLD